MNHHHCSGSCTCCKGRYCVNKVSIFSNLSEEEMEKVTQFIRHKTYRKGENIFVEGDEANCLFIVNKGSMKVFTYTKEGKEQIIYILTEGDFLGDMSLLKKGVLEYNASALEETNLCILYKDDFNNLLLENPEINKKVLEYSYDRIAELERLVQTLTTKDIDSKVATLLLNLSHSFGTQTSKGITITLPLNREDMGNYLGLTRETVSRHLSLLQSKGIIKLEGSKSILIKDIAALKELL